MRCIKTTHDSTTMPANTDYSKGKVYKLTSRCIDSVYVGSTVVGLATRKSKHKCEYKRHLAGKCAKCESSQLLALGEVDIELLETFPCTSLAELDVREGMWLRKLRAWHRASSFSHSRTLRGEEGD